jgi:hypothetical protein
MQFTQDRLTYEDYSVMLSEQTLTLIYNEYDSGKDSKYLLPTEKFPV